MSDSFDFTQTNEILQQLVNLAPETAEQMLTFGFVSNSIGLAISILLIICSIITIIYLEKKKSKISRWNETMGLDIIFVCVCVCALFFIVATIQTVALLKISYAPNVYIIDRLTS